MKPKLKAIEVNDLSHIKQPFVFQYEPDDDLVVVVDDKYIMFPLRGSGTYEVEQGLHCSDNYFPYTKDEYVRSLKGDDNTVLHLWENLDEVLSCDFLNG